MNIESPHPGHDHHLCYLVNLRFHERNWEKYAELVEDATYACKYCGRVANDQTYLCKPVKL
ncbi:MAG: hypothetical protein JW860_14355 [Sedimentisphaerales bacterium]|nr:hypothetical protein [Sedimentisphaerales bacterium]